MNNKSVLIDLRLNSGIGLNIYAVIINMKQKVLVSLMYWIMAKKLWKIKCGCVTTTVSTTLSSKYLLKTEAYNCQESIYLINICDCLIIAGNHGN